MPDDILTTLGLADGAPLKEWAARFFEVKCPRTCGDVTKEPYITCDECANRTLSSLLTAAYARGIAEAAQWIPVTERLPDSTRYVLMAFAGSPLMLIGWYFEEDGGWISDEHGLQPTHWRELPPGPAASIRALAGTREEG